VAYLVSQYPAISHAFIEREVLALRELGWEVDTFSINPPAPQQLLTAVTRQEAASTPAVLADRRRVLRANLALLARQPQVWGAGLRASRRLAAPDVRTRLWNLFYLLEAVFLLAELRRTGHRHLHVHFANNAAQVARLVTALGIAAEGPDAGWTWSLAVHGPTEFFDVRGSDLASKASSAAFVACISDFARSQLQVLMAPEHWQRLRLVRMSVDAAAFPAAGEQRDRREAGPLRILFVGRLVPEKGPTVLLEALTLLRERGTPVTATFVGGGPLADELQAQVRDRDLVQVATLLGVRGQDDLPDLYRDADVFCLPSFAEGLPVVLMEAMSTELPVVTTHIAGIPELVVDGRTGMLVSPGRPDQLADALEQLAADPATRSRLGRAGRARVLEEFQPAQNASRLAGLLTELAGARAQRLP
jgi:glycosyltransferase involved in cell wall biosynthesis